MPSYETNCIEDWETKLDKIVQETINQFVLDKNIDMLITVPRHRSVFTGMFKSSTTRRLAYETAVPILAAHE